VRSGPPRWTPAHTLAWLWHAKTRQSVESRDVANGYGPGAAIRGFPRDPSHFPADSTT